VVVVLFRNNQAQNAVVCTHGEVIGQVLAGLVVDGLTVDQTLVWPKGSSWLLKGTDGRFRFGRYLPPLPLADAPTPSWQPSAAQRLRPLQVMPGASRR